MALRKLDRPEWQTYFDRMSRQLRGGAVEIEVASLAIGDRFETDQVRLYGVTYDPKDDVLDVVMEGHDHRIEHPREIQVDEGAEGLKNVEVVDADGNRQMLVLGTPLPLPGAA